LISLFTIMLMLYYLDCGSFIVALKSGNVNLPFKIILTILDSLTFPHKF